MIKENSALTACKGCKKEIHTQAVTCPECGFSQRSRSYKNKNVAGILAFLFGGLGVHRFYLGQWWGILYLLLIWTIIPIVIALIEAIVFWVCNLTKWDKKYNEGRPASPNEANSTVLIIVLAVVGGFIAIFMLGIIAAIAIPAYQDYTLRARVHQALISSSVTKMHVIEYYNAESKFPSDNQSLGLDAPHILNGGHKLMISNNGNITISMSQSNSAIDNKTMLLEPYLEDGEIIWDCRGGDLAARYRPLSCR